MLAEKYYKRQLERFGVMGLNTEMGNKEITLECVVWIQIAQIRVH